MTCLCLFGTVMLPRASSAATAQAIDASTDAVLAQFKRQIKGADALLRDAKGVLVFPEVIQAGIVVGGQYGEGALRIGGRSVAYYSIAAGSVGFQFGVQKKSIIVVFLQAKALEDFRAKARTDKAWQVGVDGSIVLVNLGAEGSINSAIYNQPVVGFVFGQQGLMYNLSLQGSKITKLAR